MYEEQRYKIGICVKVASGKFKRMRIVGEEDKDGGERLSKIYSKDFSTISNNKSYSRYTYKSDEDNKSR